MDVLELQSTKVDWNTTCHFHILAYIYSNALDNSASYFIQILSCRERLDLDSQRTRKCTFHLDFRGERADNKGKWTYEISKNDFIFILIWLKIKTNLIKLVLNTLYQLRDPLSSGIVQFSLLLNLINLFSYLEIESFGVNTELVNVFPGLHWLAHDSLLFRLWFDNSRANCCQSQLTARARAGYSVRFKFMW